jgi:hypothetical protein
MLSRSGIAVFDALVSCKLMGRKPLYISTGRGSQTSRQDWIFRDNEICFSMIASPLRIVYHLLI